MEPVAEQLANYLQLHCCHFSLIDEEVDRVEVIYEYRHNISLPSIGNVQHILNKFTEEGRRLLSAGQLVVMNAVSDSPLVNGGANRLKGLGFGSLVYVPHLEARRWRFLLTAGRAEASEWRKDELELLPELASKIYIRIQRARAEEALRTNEQRLQRMMNVPRIGVLTFDYSGTLLSANDAFLEMLGYTRKEFDAKQFTWCDFTPPQYVEVSQVILQQLKETKRGGPYEKVYILEDGSLKWMMFVASDLGDGTIVEFAVDISERKEVEDRFRKSKERLLLATNAAKVGTFVYYPQENRSEPEEQLQSIFRLPLNGNVNLTEALKHIIHQDDRQRYADDVAMAMDPSGDGQLSTDIRIVHPDGSLHWVNVNAQVHFEGDPLQAVKMPGVATNITA